MPSLVIPLMARIVPLHINSSSMPSTCFLSLYPSAMLAIIIFLFLLGSSILSLIILGAFCLGTCLEDEVEAYAHPVYQCQYWCCLIGPRFQQRSSPFQNGSLLSHQHISGYLNQIRLKYYVPTCSLLNFGFP